MCHGTSHGLLRNLVLTLATAFWIAATGTPGRAQDDAPPGVAGVPLLREQLGAEEFADRAAAVKRLRQSARLRTRLDAELLGQDLVAGLILGQGGAPLAAAGQQQHQLPVGVLPPGFQGQQAGGVVDAGRLSGPTLLAEIYGQPVQGLHGQYAQPGPLGQSPFLKCRGLAHVKPFQEVTPV